LAFVIAQAVAIIIAAALQRAWPQALRFGSVAPELVLVLVACTGITRGAVAGCASGLLGGFLVAAGSGGGAYGSLIASHMIVGFLAGQARGRLFVDHIIAAPVVALLATVLAAFIQLVGSPPSQFAPWLAEAALGGLYNVLVSPTAYVYARAVSLRWPSSRGT
jgi:cell shape-determining protein MreD